MTTMDKPRASAQGTALDHITARYGIVLSTADAAEVLRCHPSHVRALCRGGQLSAVRVGERWKVPAAALAELIG